jgi:mannosyltransferase OCH1-like enzyme
MENNNNNNNNLLNKIYFLWGFLGDSSENIDTIYNDQLLQWRNLNPLIEIEILNPESVKILTDKSDYKSMYNNYELDIQKCDIIRYMLMYENGGIYSDLDVFPTINIKSLTLDIPNKNIFFGIESISSHILCEEIGNYYKIREGVPEKQIRISNYFFISLIKHHPIWLDILEYAKKRSHLKPIEKYILYTTGPDLITEAVLDNYNKYPDVELISNEKFLQLKHKCLGGWKIKEEFYNARKIHRT